MKNNSTPVTGYYVKIPFATKGAAEAALEKISDKLGFSGIIEQKTHQSDDSRSSDSNQTEQKSIESRLTSIEQALIDIKDWIGCNNVQPYVIFDLKKDTGPM